MVRAGNQSETTKYEKKIVAHSNTSGKFHINQSKPSIALSYLVTDIT